MDGYVSWADYDPINAEVEIAGSGAIEVKYKESDGSEYKLLLRSNDGVVYSGEYVVTDEARNRSGRVDPRKYERRGSLSVKRYESEDEILLFGRMKEGGDSYHWWVEIEKE